MCCTIGMRRLCHKNDDACEKHEENPIKHRYYVVMDGEVIAIHNDTVGIHPVYAMKLMADDLSERMEKIEKESWTEQLKEAKGGLECN